MAENNTRIISNLYEAFARRDLQALLQWIDPQVEVMQTTTLPWGGTFQGQQGIMSFASKLLENLDSQVEMEEFVEGGVVWWPSVTHMDTSEPTAESLTCVLFTCGR